MPVKCLKSKTLMWRCPHCGAQTKARALISGMARLADFDGQITQRHVNRIFVEGQSDAVAMFGDWMMVGSHLQTAIDEHEEERKVACGPR